MLLSDAAHLPGVDQLPSEETDPREYARMEDCMNYASLGSCSSHFFRILRLSQFFLWSDHSKVPVWLILDVLVLDSFPFYILQEFLEAVLAEDFSSAAILQTFV